MTKMNIDKILSNTVSPVDGDLSPVDGDFVFIDFIILIFQVGHVFCESFCSGSFMNRLYVGRVHSHREYRSCSEVKVDVYSEQVEIALYYGHPAPLTSPTEEECYFESGD